MIETLNIGTTPQDRTGDSLREMGRKVNAMFTEVYSLIDALDANKASSEAVNEALTSLANVQSDLSAKVSTEALEQRAIANETVNYVTGSILTTDQRLIHAASTGVSVSLPFQLVDEKTALTSASWTLPRLPDSFVLHRVNFTVGTYAGGLFEFAITNSDAPVAGGMLESSPAENGAVVNCSLYMRTLAQLSELTVELDISSTAEEAKGLTLWLTGVWGMYYAGGPIGELVQPLPALRLVNGYFIGEDELGVPYYVSAIRGEPPTTD